MIIDGRNVGEVLRPRSTRELGEMVGGSRGPVVPVGAGTRLSFGNPLEPVSAAIDMRGLEDVLEYVPADMTVHVGAGMPLGALQETLARQGQILPLDPWCGREATIGGIVATNSQGSLRAVGTIRDWIIGMRVVQADGRVSRTGGRVVKNVTGYDLAKLYTGSLGSLGIVAEISLKVRARYDRTASARIRCSELGDAAAMVAALRSGPFDFLSCVWTGPENEIRIRFGEHRSAVEWQLGRLPAGDWEMFDSERERVLWDEVRGLYDELAEPVVKVVALPSQITDLITRYQPQGWVAHAANGIVWMSVPPERIGDIRDEFPVMLDRASREVRLQVPTFGVRGIEYQTMRRLKAALDPDGRLNPGRHVDGEKGE